MSQVFSQILLRHKMEPMMLAFRLSATLPLGSSEKQKMAAMQWLDEVSLKLVEHGPYERDEVQESAE